MNLRVLFFFPHNLFLSRTGAHQRGLEMLTALTELGCDVTLFSSVVSSDAPWSGFSSGPLTNRPCRNLILHAPAPLEAAWMWAGRKAYRTLKMLSNVVSAGFEARLIGTSGLSTRSMRLQFRKAVANIQPDVIFMSYGWWDGLLDHAGEGHRLRIVDTIDLISVATHMRSALQAAIGTGIVTPASLPAETLREEFFDDLRDPGAALAAECAVYDKYDVSIAISRSEGKVLEDKARKTRVVTIPMTRTPVAVRNTYEGAALFAAGLNPFNVHGYAYFVSRVLPSVRALAPQFRLEVTGTVCQRLAPTDNVLLSGMVDRLEQVYADAPFLVNPVYGGTGQQVKIVDAMAHGVPVVALDRAALGSPMRHGENGLIAKNAEEFSSHVATLWRDRDLCRRLGANARATIANECAPAMLRDALERILHTRTA